MAEFDVRLSNRVRLGVDDTADTLTALRGTMRKRLTPKDDVPELSPENRGN